MSTEKKKQPQQPVRKNPAPTSQPDANPQKKTQRKGQ